MVGESYDVVVVGPAEATPVAVAKLSAALARSQGLPVAAVVRALQEKNLRLGEGLDRDRAEQLVRELQALGAITVLRQSTAARAAVQTIPTPLHGFPAAGSSSGHTLKGLGSPEASGSGLALGGGGGPGLAPLGGGHGFQGLSAFSPPGSSPALRPLGSSRAEPGARPTAMAMPAPAASTMPSAGERQDLGVSLDEPSAVSGFALPVTPAGQNPFSVPDEAEAPLELDIKAPGEDDTTSSRMFSRAPHTVAGASALNTSKITATSSASGLTTRAEEGQEDTVRCPVHGLLYDRRKNAGCRRCLEAKRGASGSAFGDRAAVGSRPGSAAIRSRRSHWAGSLSPARRAFLGLFLALGLGFGGAAYYTFGPVATTVNRLRAEQAALSGRPGTEENLARFDQIDADVVRARSRGVRNSLILWIAASGLLLAGWYRATAYP